MLLNVVLASAHRLLLSNAHFTVELFKICCSNRVVVIIVLASHLSVACLCVDLLVFILSYAAIVFQLCRDFGDS